MKRLLPDRKFDKLFRFAQFLFWATLISPTYAVEKLHTFTFAGQTPITTTTLIQEGFSFEGELIGVQVSASFTNLLSSTFVADTPIDNVSLTLEAEQAMSVTLPWGSFTVDLNGPPVLSTINDLEIDDLFTLSTIIEGVGGETFSPVSLQSGQDIPITINWAPTVPITVRNFFTELPVLQGNGFFGGTSLMNITLSPIVQDIPEGWINPDGGAFQTGANWSNGASPTSGEAAIFNIPAVYTVDLSSDVRNSMAKVQNGAVKLSVEDSKYEVDQLNVIAAPGQTALLTVDRANVESTAQQGIFAREIVVGANSTLRTGDFDQLFESDPNNPLVNAREFVRVEQGGKMEVLSLSITGPGPSNGVALAQVRGFGSAMKAGYINVGQPMVSGGGPGTAGRLEVTNGGKITSPDVALQIVVDSGDATLQGSLLLSGVATSGGDTAVSEIEATIIIIGNSGRGRFDLGEGALMEVDKLVLGQSRNLNVGTESYGQANISGTGTILRSFGRDFASIIVGDRGRGELTITEGAHVEASIQLAANSDEGPQQGIVNIGGAGTRLKGVVLNVGSKGAGEMKVMDGAVVENQIAVIGELDGSLGLLSITGAETRFLSELQLTIGGDTQQTGSARMTLSEGAQATILEPDDTDGRVRIGNQGVLEVESGASLIAKTIDVNGGDIFIKDANSTLLSDFGLTLDGTLSVSEGLATVKGGQPLTIESQGVANVTEGGAVRTARLSIDQGGEFLVTGEGSQLILDASLSNGPAADETLLAGAMAVSGRLTINQNGLVAAERVVVEQGGRIDGNGGVIDAGETRLAGNAFFNQGLVAAGASPGKLTIEGDFVQEETGIIEIEIAGLLPGVEHDVLEITGEAVIDGFVVLQFVEGFAPSQGDVLKYLQVGEFADLTGVDYEVRGLLPGFEFEISRDPLSGGFQMLALNDGFAVPEPASACIALVCSVCLVLRKRAW
ncbi:hypothetical protein [Bythopirellula goksoeyrii]|uniref:hypothetical protein n=1 Tax=Bythopirellula goksoeyrii TaxID=1400387 RepID=UPI00143D327D|nr:hypothetical protein [Bythopirellula goksoeyrii]